MFHPFKCIVIRLFYACMIFCVLSSNVAAAEILEMKDSLVVNRADTSSKIINQIFISGCRVSNQNLVYELAGLVPGMEFDSTLLAKAKRRLQKTNAFTSVALLSVYHGVNYDIYIVVVEKFYWSLSEYGGEIYNQMYGLPKTWIRARAGIAYGNVGGRFETLRLRVTGWESRSVSIGWTKPFLPTLYYLGIGGGVGFGPDRSTPWNRFGLDASVTGGKNVLTKSRIYVNVNPAYRIMAYKGPANLGELSGAHFDTVLYSPQDFLPERYDTSWAKRYVRRINGADSLWDTVYWKGNRTYIDPSLHDTKDDTVFSEMMVTVGTSLDFKDKSFNPHAGLSISSLLTTNWLLPSNVSYRYIESNSDVRWYHRGFASHNTLAYWLKLILRDGDAGPFKRISAGGEGSLRGYGTDQLAWWFKGNNSLVGSIEYRFPIFTMPTIDFSVVSDLLRAYSSFSTRFDGALFIDAAHVWQHAWQPLETDPVSGREFFDNGIGFGAGIRLLAPTIGRSGCFDFGIAPSTDKNGKLQLAPSWYLYLDMAY